MSHRDQDPGPNLENEMARYPVKKADPGPEKKTDPAPEREADLDPGTDLGTEDGTDPERETMTGEDTIPGKCSKHPIAFIHVFGNNQVNVFCFLCPLSLLRDRYGDHYGNRGSNFDQRNNWDRDVRRRGRSASPLADREAADKPPIKKKKEDVDPVLTRTGGAYIPPAKLRLMQQQITDKSR